jgi:class 3 adenylate cyclase
MGSLPSGIVAFLLTDIEASTQAWNRSTDETEAAVTSLDLDVTALVTAEEGSVIKARGEGDSHLAVFSEASRAITAAAALQRRSDTRLSLRACVLIGEARPRDGDYLSAVVNYGARIRSVAHGGQTVATRPAVDVASTHLRDGLTFRTLGVHRVKDVPAPVELLQLCGPGLRASFPPLRTRAFTTSAVMAVVAVDEVGASRRFRQSDVQVLAWQRSLIQSLRDLADGQDGRHLKLVGDGCIVAFEDPRSALTFADEVQRRGSFRIGVVVGLIDEVEGELAGRTVFEAFSLMRTAGPGEVRCCPVMQTICAHDDLTASSAGESDPGHQLPASGQDDGLNTTRTGHARATR